MRCFWICVLTALLAGCTHSGSQHETTGANNPTTIEPQVKIDQPSDGLLGRTLGLLNAGAIVDVWRQFGFDKQQQEETSLLNARPTQLPYVPDYFSDYRYGAFFVDQMKGVLEGVDNAYAVVDGNIFCSLLFQGGWAQDKLGVYANDLNLDYRSLYAKYGGTETDRARTNYFPAGKTYSFDYGDLHVRMDTVTSSVYDPRKCRYFISFTKEHIAKRVADYMADFDQLKTVGKEDKPTTLEGLLELIEAKHAPGVLMNYDLSKMYSNTQPRDPKSPYPTNYEFTAVYSDSKDMQPENSNFYLFAADDGSVLTLDFTGRWFADANGITVDALDGQFDALAGANGGQSVAVDPAGDDYDMNYSRFQYGDIYVVRKQYKVPFNGGASEVFLIIAGFSEADVDRRGLLKKMEARVWPRPDLLPKPTPNPGPVEKLLIDLATLPLQTFIQTHGFEEDIEGRRNFRMSSLVASTSSYYAAEAHPGGDEDNLGISLTVTDGTYFTQLMAQPNSFAHCLGMTEGQVIQEINHLASSYPADEKTVAGEYGPVHWTYIYYGGLVIERVVEPNQSQKEADRSAVFFVTLKGAD